MGGVAMATERSREPEVGSKVKPEVTPSGTGSDWKCGSHVFCGEKPLTSRKKHRGLMQDGGRDLEGFWSSCEIIQSKMADRGKNLGDQTRKHPCFKKKMPFNVAFSLLQEGERGPEWSTTRAPGNESKV